jgi:hypothetical protein
MGSIRLWISASLGASEVTTKTRAAMFNAIQNNGAEVIIIRRIRYRLLDFLVRGFATTGNASATGFQEFRLCGIFFLGMWPSRSRQTICISPSIAPPE